MKNIIKILVLLLCFNGAFAQVGVGTTDPKSTLDVEASSTATPTSEDGLLIPRIDEFPATNPGIDQDGMMVFITGNGSEEKGFYYWDNDIPDWVGVKDNNSLVRAKFSANTGVNQGAPGGNPDVVGWNKIVFDSETVDTNNEYDNVTGIYTAKKNGLVTVTASIVSTFNATGTPFPVGIAIYKNGTRWQKIDYANTLFTDYSRSLTINIYLETNDYLEIYLGFPETFADFNDLAEDKSRLIIMRQD
ncbi:hypothetical protein [Winogradskyella forsetii]|uniref:hypothetical protein n=1 Tax=Winogradskyella forsetii TaxID=2686077 RepID=UPI0015BACF41|nr:hypothetical protein [Winogradskyella forsetii]